METKNNNIGFFEEAKGVKSSTRLNSFILLWFFIIFNLMWQYAGNGIDGNILLFNIIVLVGIFAPKYLHKIAEMKINDLNGNTNK